MTGDFLLYGANGYTGRLILEHLAEFGLTPILAGRSKDKIKPLAEEHGLGYRISDLNDARGLDELLRGVAVVLNVAGPFAHTAKPMIEACLRTKTHYLDITGEITVFEMAATMAGQARQAGIMIMPGTGFDVVPTDCLALHLKNRLPDATHLQLAFSGLGGGISHGTATTMVESLGQSGAERRNGKIVSVPVGDKSMWVPFSERELFVMSIPWGDVSTAYYSTGIANIETYTGISPKSYKWVKWMPRLNWLLRRSVVQRLAKKMIDRRPAGPSAEQRADAKSLVWGRVTNAIGESHSARLTTLEGYTLTALTSLLITQKVLNGSAPVGFQTPAKAYGPDLVMEVEDTIREDID